MYFKPSEAFAPSMEEQETSHVSFEPPFDNSDCTPESLSNLSPPYGMVHTPMELSSPTDFHGFLEDSIPSKHIPTQSGTCKLETT